MPDLAFDLRYIRYAILVAEHGSFRRVAEIMNISPTTVSRRVQLLERRLGIPLFERGKQGSRLTRTGERFIRDAEAAVDQLSRAIFQARLLHRGELGELQVGITSSIANGPLGDLIQTFRERYPQVRLKLEEASPHAIAARVLSGRLDIGLLPKGPSIDGCEHADLWVEPLLVAVGRDHRLVAVSTVTWEDLTDETFLISADEAQDIESCLLQQFASLPVQPKISEHAVSRENLLNLTAQGFGVVLTLASSALVERPDLAFIPVTGTPSQIHAVWLKRRESSLLSQFIQIARAKADR